MRRLICVIKGIKAISEVSDYTPLQKSTREAELRYLRAFYYWHIVETWGGVHFTTEPTDGVITTANKTSVDTFYNQIFIDLQFAVTNLPATAPGDYGRAWQPVSKGILVKNVFNTWQKCRSNCIGNDVIKNYGFTLVPKYRRPVEYGNSEK
jgi:hypothetical protein